MTDYLRFETSLAHRHNKFAILIEARLWDAHYEWVGADPPPSRRARGGDKRHQGEPVPAAMKPDEDVVYDVCIELLRDRHLSDATFDAPRR